MAAQSFTVVCAWCHHVIRSASHGAAVTHTICSSCMDWMLAHPGHEVHEGVQPRIGELEVPPGYFGDTFER